MAFASRLGRSQRSGSPPPGRRHLAASTITTERVVYDTITELYGTRTLSQPTYDRALDEFGVEALIELITGAGFYTVAATTINAFQYQAPGDARPLPD